MRTIKTQKLAEHELRLVLIDTQYVGVANRKSGGQVARIDGTDPDSVWNGLLAAINETNVNYFGFPGAVQRFRSFFPAGFDDPRYLTTDGIGAERAYKVAASEALRHDLPLESVLEGRTSLGEAALRAFHRTNFLATQEKYHLPRLLRGPDADRFISAAARFAAHGDEAALLGLRATLHAHGFAKWTFATYLPFLWLPDRHMFLKPEVTKDFATRVGDRFANDYQATLGISVYDSLLRLVSLTKTEITRAGLSPRDNIDLQSFIWTVGKYADKDAAGAEATD